MKEISHKTLAYIVGTSGTQPLRNKSLEILIESSVEPDTINLELIANDILNSLIVPIEWLINHGIRAKELAARSIMESSNAYQIRDNAWIKYLGWVFHYIADWGTPHHAPFSRSNPIPALMGAGLLIGGLFGGLSKAGQGLKEVLKAIAKGVAIGGGISGTVALIDLAIEHNEFEKHCDRRIKENLDLVVNTFKKNRKSLKFENIFNALQFFEIKMDELRQDCNNLPKNWVYNSDNKGFASYLAKIAVIMDIASQIVMG